MKFKPFVLFKESKLITKQAKAIFGSDIVDCAGFGEVIYSEALVDYQKERLTELKGTSQDIGEDNTWKTIDIGSKTIVIKFNNGKTVCFNSSEWGDISEVKEIKNLEE